MTPQEIKSSPNCNFGHDPIPAKCLIINECTGFSPQPAYCSMKIDPTPVHNVPEPMTYVLFGLGLALIMIFRKLKEGK